MRRAWMVGLRIPALSALVQLCTTQDIGSGQRLVGLQVIPQYV